MSFFENDESEKVDKRDSMYIWAEKYRPHDLNEYLGNEQIKERVAEYIKTGEIPHLLFYSRKPGTGKCLDYSEYIDIEIEVSEDEGKILAKFEI